MYERALAGSAVRTRWAVDSRGARVHLVERGSQASGPPVVLLHGTTACAGFFVPMLAELDGLHVVAADRPGQGLSDPIELPRAQFRESAVAWTDRLLDTLELRSTALVGHSGGALWALWYTLAHPDRVDRLVLFGPPTIPGTRCPVPLRVVATPGIGALLARGWRLQRASRCCGSLARWARRRRSSVTPSSSTCSSPPGETRSPVASAERSSRR